MGEVKKIQVIGLHVDGEPLVDDRKRLILEADVAVGGSRQLDLIPFFAGRKISIRAEIESVLTDISHCLSKNLRVVVLATGDPLLFGIGNTLIRHFGKEVVTIHPAVSAVQVALTRLGFNTSQAVILSRHGNRTDDLRRLLHCAIGVILTSHGSSVADIADEIIAIFPHARNWNAHLCQCLGMREEKIQNMPLAALCNVKTFQTPNLLVVENPHPILPDAPPANFGRTDDAFVHDQGMITHPEVRAITLSKLSLGNAEVLWDVGAGSGAVGIEAALLNPYARVFAVEKNADRYGHILANKENHQAHNLFPLHEDALTACASLPAPNRVFIGGGGAALMDLLDLCYGRLLAGGIMVINTIAVESFDLVHRFSKKIKKDVSCMTVQVSRLQPLATYHAFKPENPITLFEITK